MRKILLGAVLGGGIVAALAAAGWWVVAESGWLAFKPTAPHPANLAAGIERYLLASASPRSPPCASIGQMRNYPPSRARTSFEDSQFDFTPASFRVVLQPNLVSGWEADVPKLQFLAKQGLLASRTLPEGATEFTLTWQGFAHSNEQGCFQTIGGGPSASVVTWSKTTRDGVVYEATARVAPGEAAQWTRDPEFVQAFGNQFVNALEPKLISYQLVRNDVGFTVIAQDGKPVHSGTGSNPTLIAVNAQRAGRLDRERVRSLVQTALDGPMASMARVCLPIPTSQEVDETDLIGRSVAYGFVPPKQPATFTFYNLLDAPGNMRLAVLRGYEAMRKLESLGVAKSEQLPATEFKNAQASGAVRFTLDADTVEALHASPARCLVVAKLAVDDILDFEQIESWKTSVRFSAKLKLVPAGPLGERALQVYGHLRRMAEVGVGWRHSISITANGLSLAGGSIKQVAFDPDVSKTSLPVVIGEKTTLALPKGGTREAPVHVRLMPVLGMSRLSVDGLTMVYSGGGTSTYAKSSVARSTGKWYAEATLKTRPGAKAPDTYTTVGVARNPKADSEFITGLPRAEAFNMRALRQPIYDGETVGIAFDADEGRAYFFRGGNWVSGPPGHSGAGVRIPKSVEYVIFASSSASSGSLGGDAWTLNFGGAPFEYPIPTGYFSWDARISSTAAKKRVDRVSKPAPQPPGVEGAMNRCRDRSGKTVYIQRPCATAGMEQLGVVQGSAGPAPASRTSVQQNGGDRIILVDPRTGSVQTIPYGRSGSVSSRRP